MCNAACHKFAFFSEKMAFSLTCQRFGYQQGTPQTELMTWLVLVQIELILYFLENVPRLLNIQME